MDDEHRGPDTHENRRTGDRSSGDGTLESSARDIVALYNQTEAAPGWLSVAERTRRIVHKPCSVKAHIWKHKEYAIRKA
jgi:hypothetical protein